LERKEEHGIGYSQKGLFISRDYYRKINSSKYLILQEMEFGMKGFGQFLKALQEVRNRKAH